MMNPDINRKILKFETFINEVLKEDLAKLDQKINVKNADVAEFLQLKSTITTLQNNGLDKSGFKTQVDVGQNFFIEAHVPDASTILLDVGLAHYVELSLNDALAVINVRIKLLEQQIAHLRKEVAKTNAHIKLILLGIGELQGFKEAIGRIYQDLALQLYTIEVNRERISTFFCFGLLSHFHDAFWRRAFYILMSDWRSIPCEERHKQFLEKFIAFLIDSTFESVSRKNPVLRWREPGHLQNIINFGLEEEPRSQDSLLEIAVKIFKYSAKTGHPYFMNQLFSGLDPYGLAGQWLTDALNSSLYTYEVAPVLTLMEKTVIKKMLSMFYNEENGITIGDGLFCPGGSFGNGIAINLARFSFRKKTPDNKKIPSTSLVLFTSEDAHYSVLKWGNVCDVEVILIKTDEYGRMDVNDLRVNVLEEQKKGNHPFSVSATAGTTVLGAFDPLIEIADVCQEFGMWLHVDAAWGGGLIFSRKHSVLLRGIQRADSILFNPHKLLAIPQQCSVLLSKHENIFKEAHSKQAPYLFQKDKFYSADLDVGDKYLQCGRRPDVLKFWFMWQAKGSVGFEKHVNHLMTLSALFREEVEKREGFELVMDSCFINVCFWFVPPSLRNQNLLCDYKKRLNKVAPKLKEKMAKRGSLMINYQPLHEKPNFFRFVIQNSGVSAQDIYYVFDELENLGEFM